MYNFNFRRMSRRNSYTLGTAGKIHWEDDLQIKVVEYLRLQYPKVMFTSFPANHFIKPYLAKKQKAMGYSTGTPDLCIPYRNGESAGIWIELKSEGAEYTDASGMKKIHKRGTLSAEQIVWLEYLKAQGFVACCCTGFDEAKKAIDAYLRGAQ